MNPLTAPAEQRPSSVPEPDINHRLVALESALGNSAASCAAKDAYIFQCVSVIGTLDEQVANMTAELEQLRRQVVELNSVITTMAQENAGDSAPEGEENPARGGEIVQTGP
jgi:hypothetical protein